MGYRGTVHHGTPVTHRTGADHPGFRQNVKPATPKPSRGSTDKTAAPAVRHKQRTSSK
jgi:hypothetical protein